MRKTIFILSAFTAIIAVSIAACTNTSAGTKKTTAAKDSAARVLRGTYLVNSMGCDDCHSPKRMTANGPEIIPELRLSGFPHNGKVPPVDTSVINKGWAMLNPDLTSAVGFWGESFAANLTSDATGIGNWSEEQFMYAIRHGKLKGLESSRNLLPPMPWFVYKNLTDEDLKSIYAFLKTTKPVENVVPAPKAFSDLN